jgi:hypothetical protein
MSSNRETPQPTNWSIAKRCAVITGFWLFFSVLSCLNNYFDKRGMGKPSSWHDAALEPFVTYIIWTFLIPLVVAFTAWIKRLHLSLLPWLAAHTLFALVAMILFAVGWAPFPQPPDSDLVAIPRASFHFIQLQFLFNVNYCAWMYWTIVGFVYGIDYYLDGRAAQILAAELEGQLVRAELDVLKQQLQPHFLGSARQSVRKCILCGFLESDEFGLGGCQALRFQQQVIEVAVTPTTAQQRFDVSIDGFLYPQPYFSLAVVKNSFQMFE